MDKFLKDFRVDIKSATRGGRRKMRAAVAEMKKRHDKLLKKTKLNKRSRSQVIEGSGSSTNESDGTYSDVGSSPSSIYLSINAEADDDVDLKPTEPHTEADLSPEVSQSSSLLIDEYGQSSRTTEDDDPHSHVDLPPFAPEATDENSKFIGIEAERENDIGDIEDPKADLKRDHPTRKLTPEQTFVIVNFMLEVPSAIFDQLSSAHKIQFALLSMLMSMATMIVCISELIYKVRSERVAWKWKEKIIIPWLYYPPPSNKPFGSVTVFIGLFCSIFQCIFTITTYACFLRHSNNPIKISMWPIIFSFGLLCSKLQQKSQRED